MRSQPAWAAWIEISSDSPAQLIASASQPAWAAWIEIQNKKCLNVKKNVAARMGCVD